MLLNSPKLLQLFAPEGDAGGGNSNAGQNGGPEMKMPHMGKTDRQILDLPDDDGDNDGEEKEGQEDDEESSNKRKRSSDKSSRQQDDDDVDDNDDDSDNDDDTEDDNDDDSSDDDSGDDTDDGDDDNQDDDEDSDDDSEDEDESDEGGGDEDELNGKTIYQKIKKLSPGLLKKIPELRDVIARESQFSEMFDSPEQAKVASQNSELLNSLYTDISSGKVKQATNFLKAIEKIDKEDLRKFAHTIIPAIGEISPDLYGSVLRVPVKHAIMGMYNDGLRAKNKNLAAAAVYAHEYFFDTQNMKAVIKDGLDSSVEETEAEKKLKTQLNDVNKARLGEFKGDVQEAINHSLRNRVIKSLEGVKKSDGSELSDYDKRNLIRDMMSQIDESMSADKRHMSGMDSLFEQALSANLSKEWKSRLITAYLGRAKLTLDSVKVKVLRDAGIKVKTVKKDVRRITPDSGSGRSANRDDKSIDWSRVDRTRTTDRDILDGRVHYKK